MAILCYQSMITSPSYDISLHHEIMAMKATADPDTMYLHEALREPDRKEFIKAMRGEIDSHINSKNLTLIHKTEVPEKTRILPMVWQMRRKRDITTGKVKKYKARLVVDGSKMIKNLDFTDTYAPVTTWPMTRILLTLVAMYQWHTIQLDYVAAYPQAPAAKPLYLKLPSKIDIKNGKREDYVLRMDRNLYGTKNSGRVWNIYLVKNLCSIGFFQSNIDDCLFYRGKTIMILYTDDSILAGPDKGEIEKSI